MVRTTEQTLLDMATELRGAVVPLVRQLRQQRHETFTPTAYSAIGAIHRLGPLSLGELAARERLSLPMISKVVTVLEAAGMVERLADPSDRRVCLVRTTAECERWIEDGQAQRDRWLAERLAELDAADRATLAAALPILEQLIAHE